MSLFGPPNVDKYRKYGNIKKLVKLLTDKNPHIVSSALNALQQIADNKNLEKDREGWWDPKRFESLIKKINKLDNDKQVSIEKLTQKLKTEKDKLEKKIEAKHRDVEELTKRLEENFILKYESNLDKENIEKLLDILGKNKDFLFTKKWHINDNIDPRASAWLILTIEKVIIVQKKTFANSFGIRYDEIKEIKKSGSGIGLIQIITNEKYDIEFYYDENDKELIDFLENKFQKFKMSS